MSNKKIHLTFLFLLLLHRSISAANYTIDLKSESWNISPKLYHISNVVDERKNKKDAGQVLISGKPVRAEYRQSLEKDLEELVKSSMIQDTSTVPLSIVVKTFTLNETGTQSRHKATLEYSIAIYRIEDDEKIEIFQLSGKPELVMQGNYPRPHEKNITSVMKALMENFEQWVSRNSDIPPLAKSVKVLFKRPSSRKISGDTIQWSPEYKLSWNDFKGTPPSSPFMAQSNCMFSYGAEPSVTNSILELNVELMAFFEKRGSWSKAKKNSDGLLAHEQLHFDICELYIRKLKNEMLHFTFHPLKFQDEIRKLFDDTWEEYQHEQEKYDEQTGHGIDEKKQEQWSKEITSRLIELDSLSE